MFYAAVNWAINCGCVHLYICCFTSDYRSLVNFSILSLTFETIVFINNQNYVFSRASVNGVVLCSS